METEVILALAAIFVLLMIGVEIVVCLGLGAVLLVLTQDQFTLDNIGIAAFSEINLFPLLAMPLYILTGDLIAHGGLAQRLIDFSKALVGWIRGSMAVTLISAAGLFSAISGSNAATVAALGRMMIPSMEKDGYPKDFSAAVAACGGTTGIIIPPSITFVIYGVASGTSIGALFLAGTIPGILMVVAMSIVASIQCKRLGIGSTFPFSWREVGRTAVRGNLAFGAMVIILGGIYGGVFTATEAAAVAVAYCFLVGVLITREIKVKDLPRITKDSADVVGLIAPVIAMAIALSQILAVLGLPKMGVDAMLSISSDPNVLLFVILVILLVAGMFMETTPVIILLTPMLVPIAHSMGIHPVHFGVIVNVALAIGFVTPPVGLNLFVASAITGVSVTRIAYRSWWMIVALLLTLVLIAYVPWFSLVLIPG